MMKRIFIASDLHGFKDVYDGMISYLEEIKSCCDDEVIFYINGDIIDRGDKSIEMLIDVMERSNGKKGNIKVVMIAGSHEWLMFNALKEANNVRERTFEFDMNNPWFLANNGGEKTALDFSKLSRKKQEEIYDFLDDMEICVKFDGTLWDDKGVVLAHAYPPRYMDIRNKCRLKLGNLYVRDCYNALWKRPWDLKKNEKLGLDNNITIIGHTPLNGNNGYTYDSDENVLNIDGGCANILDKDGKDILAPLVELDFNNKQINMHLFNKDGELVTVNTIDRAKTKRKLFNLKSKDSKKDV